MNCFFCGSKKDVSVFDGTSICEKCTDTIGKIMIVLIIILIAIFYFAN